MALQVSAQANGVGMPSSAEEEELYAQLLRLEDAVLSGRHPHFKLPATAIEQLKASLIAMSVPAVSEQAAVNSLQNGVAFSANAAANRVQPSATPTIAKFAGLPGLQTQAPTLKSASSSGLDPIFLEKSDSLVRAEGQLKRQRIERDLQAQVEQRKHMRDKDLGGADAPSSLDVEAILVQSGARESHVSGLRPTKAATPASSFDENDYYSSQVQSDWSSPDSAGRGSDRAAGAFAANFEQSEDSHAPFAKGLAAGKQSLREPINLSSNIPVDVDMYDAEDDDDEYAPPDAAAFDNRLGQSSGASLAYAIPPEDEDSDYEPGEITQESNLPKQYYQGMPSAQSLPHVPLIRNNHLTHIAAPQPNRVSPLAVAKGPTIELELVNGRPEVVHKAQSARHAIHSRPSTASPPANGVPGSSKKRRTKKRKREVEPSGRSKRKRERQIAGQSPGTGRQEPRIKDEPISPPPFHSLPEVPQYAHRPQYEVQEVDLVSPRYAPLHTVHSQEQLRSALRYEYAPPASSAVIGASSPSYRPVQRDTQDLRRIASLHHAQQPASPAHRAYSPTPHRTVSMTYGDPRLSRASIAPVEAETARYGDQPPLEEVRYVRQRSRSPPRLQEYHDPYARAQSPAMMPPPSATPRKIVVDQYGNHYYAADPSPALPPVSVRASVAPSDLRTHGDAVYERAPSRMSTSYRQPPPVPRYEPIDTRMAPPPLPSRRQIPEDAQAPYVEAAGYHAREYSTRPPEQQQSRYVESQTSPVYQAPSRYEQMPPPAPPAREPTSPVYAPPRSYSVRPEELPAAYTARQTSVAPVQYFREAPPAPLRAISVAPGYEQPPQAYSHAPQVPPVRYVDQYGREVYAEVRQVPAADYRYQ